MLPSKGTGKSNSSQMLRYYFSARAAEGTSYFTALSEVHFVPRNKLRVTKEEREGQQEPGQAVTPAMPMCRH